jgi:hypothetical protein
LEREKASLMLECRDAQTAADRLASEKANIEKDQKLTLAALGDVQVNFYILLICKKLKVT